MVQYPDLQEAESGSIGLMVSFISCHLSYLSHSC